MLCGVVTDYAKQFVIKPNLATCLPKMVNSGSTLCCINKVLSNRMNRYSRESILNWFMMHYYIFTYNTQYNRTKPLFYNPNKTMSVKTARLKCLLTIFCLI